ncbi:hypothetical protein D3C86_1156270 [compost metagenome]
MAVDQRQGAVFAQIAQADGRQAVGLGRALAVGQRHGLFDARNIRERFGQVHVAALEQGFTFHADDGRGGVEDVFQAGTGDDHFLDCRGLIVVPRRFLNRLAYDGQGAGTVALNRQACAFQQATKGGFSINSFSNAARPNASHVLGFVDQLHASLARIGV